jgi:hypothetical protein
MTYCTKPTYSYITINHSFFYLFLKRCLYFLYLIFIALTIKRLQNITTQHSTDKYCAHFFAQYPWLSVRLRYILCQARRKPCAGCTGVLVHNVRLTYLSLSLIIPCCWSTYDNRKFSTVLFYRLWGVFFITFI